MQQLYKDKLSSLDDITINALQAAFDERIEKNKPFVNTTDDDALLGQKYRAYEESKELVRKTFTDIKSYKFGSPNIKGFAKER